MYNANEIFNGFCHSHKQLAGHNAEFTCIFKIENKFNEFCPFLKSKTIMFVYIGKYLFEWQMKQMI